VLEYVDVAVLAAALAAASYFALKARSRRGILVVTGVSLAYFGFYRMGCVCPVGATQNCVLALGQGAYAVSLGVAAMFLLPLVFTLLFGRTFCSGVCPLGAVQDLVLIHPLRLPRWLSRGLGMLPYVYLAAAVLLAFTGSAFLICRYDPFVTVFRLVPLGKWIQQGLQGSPAGAWWQDAARTDLLVLTGAALVASMFIGRPYCRFVCPYAVLLRACSRLSKWHVTITPDECVQCRLCEDSCPFDAIEKPTPPASASRRTAGRGALAAVLAISPVLIAAGAAAGFYAGGALARTDYAVRFAGQIAAERAGQAPPGLPGEALHKAARPPEQVYAEADALGGRFRLGGALAGAFVGLAGAAKLVVLSIRRTRKDYLPNRAECVSCGRCLAYCPIERRRRGLPPAGGSQIA